MINHHYQTSTFKKLFMIMFMAISTRFSVFGFKPQSIRTTKLTRFVSKMQADTVRVRFAPSPTGSLHVGGARTALFNWLYAKKTGGKFIIRVEDTDESRSTRESEKSILDDLRWLNLNWDEGPEVNGEYGPYRQSERKQIYKEIAEKLIADGKAYRCFCTEDELEEKRIKAEEAGEDPKYDGTWRDADPVEIQKKLDNGDPYTVRFRVPEGKIVSIDDIVRGTVTWDADASLGDFIILRSNGMPVYNFCVSVDDSKMKITHVIRAEEHLTNTLRQMLIMEALEYPPPTYAHCSLILGSDRSKLSKRHGATSVQQFSEQGFIADAMVNYLATLGWNDGTDKEIYTPQELAEAFDLNRIIKSAAVFDMTKLTWINTQHLKLLDYEKMSEIVLKELSQGDDKIINSDIKEKYEKKETPESFNKFLTFATKIAQRDMELTVDTNKYVGNCLKYDIMKTIEMDENVDEVVKSEGFKQVLEVLIRDFEAGLLPTGIEENFGELWKPYMKNISKELKLKGKGIFQPVRLLITGRMSGPDIGEQMQLFSSTSNIQDDMGGKFLVSGYPMVSLKERIEFLKGFSFSDAENLINSRPVKLNESVDA